MLINPNPLNLRRCCNLLLRKNQTIRAILGSFLLLIFLTGITPKRYWHDLLADHTDVLASVNQSDQLQINQAGFNCDCNTLVATSPFTETVETRLENPLPVHQQYHLVSVSQLYHSDLTYYSLRGPPAIG